MPRPFAPLAVAALLSIASAPQHATPQRARPPEPSPPTLVVLLTVNQLRPDYLDRWSGQLTGGLGRLTRGGAVFTNAFQDHAVTETAPGHASTLSGRFPRSTGIVRNTAGVQDPQAPLIAGGGPAASPFRFRGSTLIDWMRSKDPRSRALALQGVRELRLGAGPQPDLLAVSLSTTDAVGHRYGPDSREIHDQVLRLDRVLGVFLDSLFTLRDSTRIVIALTADHGVAPVPEIRAAAGDTGARRVDVTALVDAVRRRVLAGGVDTAAFYFEDGVLFLDRAAFRRAGVQPTEALDGRVLGQGLR